MEHQGYFRMTPLQQYIRTYLQNQTKSTDNVLKVKCGWIYWNYAMQIWKALKSQEEEEGYEEFSNIVD